MLTPIIYEFIKGRPLAIGTESLHGGIWKKKMADGKWKAIKGRKGSAKKTSNPKKAAKKVTKKIAKKKTREYVDVGEKIGGARKDLAVFTRKRYLSDKTLSVSHRDHDLLEEQGYLKSLLTRDRQFGSIKELYDLAIVQGSEENPLIGYSKLLFVDALPAKPPNSKEGRAAYMAMTRLVTSSLENITDQKDIEQALYDLRHTIAYSKPYEEIFSARSVRTKFMNALRVDRFVRVSYTKEDQSHKKDGRLLTRYVSSVINDLIEYEEKKGTGQRTKIKDEKQKQYAVTLLNEYFSGSKKPVSRVTKQKPNWESPTLSGQATDRIGPASKKKYTAKALIDNFGFRGVEYGNWVKGKDAQSHTQLAGQALEDLSRTVGISPKEISLNGRLALSFGGRGKGGPRAACAHYEPLRKVINLTKQSGSGSLAHEWFHAVDNIFHDVFGGGDQMGYITAPGSRSEVLQGDEQVREKAKDLLDALMRGDHNGDTIKSNTAIPGSIKESKEDSRRNFKPQIKSMLDTLVRYKRHFSESFVSSPAYRKLSDHRDRMIDGGSLNDTQIKEATQLISENWKEVQSINWNRNSQKYMDRQIEDLAKSYADFTDKPFVYPSLKKAGLKYPWRNSYDRHGYYSPSNEGRYSNTYACSVAVDGTRSKKYWSKPYEIAARCFETYVFDKLQAANQKNDYLVKGNISEDEIKRWSKRWEGSIPKDTALYPFGEERKKINKAFDEFFVALKQNKTFQKAISYLEAIELPETERERLPFSLTLSPLIYEFIKGKPCL